MLYYKIYGLSKDGSLFSFYQPGYMKHPLHIGVHYTAKEVQAQDSDMLEEDMQFYGLHKPEMCIPYLMESVTVDEGYSEQDWVDYFTCPITYEEGLDQFADCPRPKAPTEITVEKLVIVECEGSLKNDAFPGEELTFYDQTVLRIVREITNEELEAQVHSIFKAAYAGEV